MKILKMTKDLFTQRQRVMDMLYDARNILNTKLPYIKVRIVDFEEQDKVLGKCFIDKDYITISKDLISWNDDYLREVVWHELAHAYFNAKHDEVCPLMAPKLSNAHSREVLVEALKTYKKE